MPSVRGGGGNKCLRLKGHVRVPGRAKAGAVRGKVTGRGTSSREEWGGIVVPH